MNTPIALICGIVIGAALFSVIRVLAKPVVTRKNPVPPVPPRKREMEAPTEHPAGAITASAPGTSAMEAPISLTLLDPGSSIIMVIKNLREATGLGLAEAKRLVDQAPSVVTALSPAHATRLRKALLELGAKIDSGPASTDVPQTEWREEFAPGRHRVMLQVLGPNKIMAIKIVREATGLGLAEAKHLVESAPILIKEAGTAEAHQLVRDLMGIGARATVEPL